MVETNGERDIREILLRKEEPDSLTSSDKIFHRRRCSADLVFNVLVAVLEIKQQGLCSVVS